jgi:hypothetical protein
MAKSEVVEKKEVAVTAKAEVVAMPADMIRLAMEKGANLKELAELMTLQERFEATQAKKLYNAGMVEVQKGIPIVAKSLKNNQTNSKYASLDDIIFETKKIYTAHGFSITFYEGETVKPEHVRICADVVHSAGHKETYYYDVPLDGKGIKGNANMTAIHAKASSTSYAHRYLMCLIWNIPTGDDNDAQGVSVEYITVAEHSNLVDLITSTKSDMQRFLKFMKVENLAAIRKNDLQKAVMALNAKMSGPKAKA